MANELLHDSHERMLQEWLKGEFRVLNAHLPSELKPLSVLLNQKHPYVTCSDGTPQLFKKKELAYLASLLDAEEQARLLLPILIELGAGQGEVFVICRGKIEEKVISHILDMPVACKQGRVSLYRPQLSVLRKVLKTTTQYLFSTEVLTT